MKTEKFQGLVRDYMIQRHIKTLEQLRSHTTVGSNATFLKYYNNPELMPIGVFLQIMKSLNVPKDKQIKLWEE